MGLGRSVGGRLQQAVAPRGPSGPQGPAGVGALGVDVWNQYFNDVGNPALNADWGPYINSLITAGHRRLDFSEHNFPFSTPLALNGQSFHCLFQGAQGRGWYPGASIERVGSRLIWKGGASPTVSGTDGSITSGSKVFTSASGPFTNGGGALNNVYHAGQSITINGAGPAGAALVTKIVSRGSATQVTLADAASTTVSGASWSFTDWTRVLQCQGSSGVEFRDMRIVYDNPAFDGILIDMRSDPTTWAARGRLYNCVVGGDNVDFTNQSTPTVYAYALVHLSGHGEQFRAQETAFGGAKAIVRGMYQNNADDAVFDQCAFQWYYEACTANPGRFWEYKNCFWQGSNGGGQKVGPIFKTDTDSSLSPVVSVRRASFWDFGGSGDRSAGATMANGSTTLTIATAYSDLVNFTNDLFWKDRIVHVAGAGPGGTDLHTRVVKRLSSTQLQLRDAASAAVSNVGWWLTDGGIVYQEPGFTWWLYMEDIMSWTGAAMEFEMRGAGVTTIRNWWTNREMRDDILGYAQYIQFGDPATNKQTITVENTGFNSANVVLGSDHAIQGYAGHDIVRIANSPFSLAFEKIDYVRHTSLQTGGGSASSTPSAAAHAGQTLSSIEVHGNDEVGYVLCSTGAGGATAGDLLDITFLRSWPTLTAVVSNEQTALFSIILTPLEDGGTVGRGANSAKAAAYAKSDKDNDNGWTLGIGNAVSGAQSLGWSYRIVRT